MESKSEAFVDHPSFPQPADTSILLWRYIDQFKFEWLLKYSRLFMSRADQLEDYLEGTTPGGEFEHWKSMMDAAVSDEQRKTLEHNRRWQSDFAKHLRSSFYVSCWHANPFENHGMWGTYTAGTTNAVAIRTTYANLRRCIPAHVDLGMVRYLDYKVERLPTSNNIFEAIMHKDRGYEWEREARLVVSTVFKREYMEQDFHRSASDLGVTMYAPVVDPSKLIQGIVLHPKAPLDFRLEVQRLSDQYGIAPVELSRQNREPRF